MTTIAKDPEVMAKRALASSALRKLDLTRREWLRFQVWLGLARIVLAELALGAALVLADWMWVLPVSVRALGLVALAALAPYLIFRFRRPLDEVETAAEVEGHFPELGQRLRTVVEYAEPATDTVPASAGLVRALGRDTDQRTSGLDFRKLVPWVAFERRAVAVFLAILCGVITLFASPELRTAVARMLLLPLHYTSLKVQPGDTTLKAGQELELKAVLSGRPVPAASWSYRKQDSGGRWVTASLAPERAAGKPAPPLLGTLSAILKDCQTDFDYRVKAGEVESPTFHVKVVHPLVVKAVEATITPPAYTRRPPEVVKEGNFRAIEGSRVGLAITLDHAPKTAELLLKSPAGSSPRPFPLALEGSRLTGLLPPITGDMVYQIDATDAEGMKLEEPESYRVKVQLDDKPNIRFIQPDESLAVTPTTEVPIKVEAGDDFGVSQLGINYKVGDGPEETLHLGRLENQPVTAGALATLYLEKHKLSFTDAITYYAFVEDNYPPKPHRVVSELRYIDILPYKQTYELVEGGSGTCNGSISLEELIARQRVNLSRTFLVERDRSMLDRAAMRLATFEEELATATADFSEGLKSRGVQVPALDDAASAMQAATRCLDTKDLPTARTHEETALKWLISARQNLRKLLALSGSSQQASACRKFDREQVQKIRRPPQDESKKELAELEEDLRELAQRERDFSEEIEARGAGGAELEPPREQKQAASSPQPPAEPSPKPPGSASAKSSSKAAQTKSSSNRVQDQKQASEEAERLRRVARRDPALTELANRRLDAAAQAVQDANKSIEAGREQEAAQEARLAAAKLEAAARQVGALKARELTDRLARQRDIAQAIAKAEKELGRALERKEESKDGGTGGLQRLAQKQSELADDVAVLADALGQLKLAAAEEQPELAESIVRATKANPPDEVEESMRKNAAMIAGDQAGPAARAADRAAGQLDALAQDLESARRDAMGPLLQRLLAAEKQAAELQQRLRSLNQPSQQAESEKALADLAHLVDNLAPGDGPLRDAADKLTQASQSSHSGWVYNDRVQPGESGYFVPPVASTGSLAATILALQTKIQEIILDNALVERTGPVPPQYKDLVEDYYRILSQDLR